jgi:hypothetical protein
MVAVHETLYIAGGWNSTKQFDDLYTFDTNNRVWTRVESASGDKWGENTIPSAPYSSTL